MTMEERKTLAWHETLEIHELVAAQSNGLIKLKMSIGKIDDPELKKIYKQAIQDLVLNLNELMGFYSSMPSDQRAESNKDLLSFFAGDLLAFSKAMVRNYAGAITETATPILRKTLTNQLLRAIKCHEKIFNYMYKKGYYPAYDLNQLLKNDLKNAEKAISMEY